MTLISNKIPNPLNSMSKPLEIPSDLLSHRFPLVVLRRKGPGEQPSALGLDGLDFGTQPPKVLASPQTPGAATAADDEFHIPT